MVWRAFCVNLNGLPLAMPMKRAKARGYAVEEVGINAANVLQAFT